MIIKDGWMVLVMPLKIFIGGNFRGTGVSGHDHEREMMTKILKDLDKALKDVNKEYYLFIDVVAESVVNHKKYKASMDALLISKEGAIILELKKLNGDFKVEIKEYEKWIEDSWINKERENVAQYDNGRKMEPIAQVNRYRNTLKNIILKFLEKEGNLSEKEKNGLSNYVSAYIVIPTTTNYKLEKNAKEWLEKNLWLKIMDVKEAPEKVIQKLSGEDNPITKEINERFGEFIDFWKRNLKSPRKSEITEIPLEDIPYWPKYGDGESRKSIEVGVEFSVIDDAFRGTDDELIYAINVINYLNIQEKYLYKIENALKSDRGYKVRVLALDTLLRNMAEDDKKMYLMRLLDDPDVHFFREVVEKLTYLLPDDMIFRRFASILDKIDVNRLNILLNVIEKYPSEEFLNPLIKLYGNLPGPTTPWPHFPECGAHDENHITFKYQILKSIGHIHTEKSFIFLTEKILSKESLECEPINRAILDGIEEILKNIMVSENEKNKLIENFYELLKEYNPKYGYTSEYLGMVSFEKRKPDDEQLNEDKKLLTLKIVDILSLLGTENAFDMALKIYKEDKLFRYKLISNLSMFDISLDRLIEFFNSVGSYEKMQVAVEIAKRDIEKGWGLFNSLEDSEKLRLPFIKILILKRVPGYREFLIDKIEFDRVSSYSDRKEWKEIICEFSSSDNKLSKEDHDEIMSFLYEILKKAWKQGEDVSFHGFSCNPFINWIGNHAQKDDFDMLWDLFLSTYYIKVVSERYEENKIRYSAHPVIEAMIKINHEEFKNRINMEIKNEIENGKNDYDFRRQKERFLEVGIFKGIVDEELIMEIINKSWKEPSEKLYFFISALKNRIENIDRCFYNEHKQHFYEILDDIQNKDAEKYYSLADLLFSMIVRFEGEDGIEKIVKYRDKFFNEVVWAISSAPYLKTAEYVFQFARENRECRDTTFVYGFLETLRTLKENNVGLLFAKKNSIEIPDKFMSFLKGESDGENTDFFIEINVITLFYFLGNEVLDVLFESGWNSKNTYRRLFKIKYIFDISKENEELCKEIMDKKDKYRKKLYEIGKIVCTKNREFMWSVEEMLNFLDRGCGETIN